MVNIKYSIEDAKSLIGMLDMVVRVMGQNISSDNAKNMTVEINRAASMRDVAISALKEAEEALSAKVQDVATKPAN